MASPPPFLISRWDRVLVLSWAVEPGILLPHLPEGVELDRWRGDCHASLVGLRFRDTRVLGLPIPFHRMFLQVNLRFYVRRRTEEGWRPGLVFVRELVSRRAVAIASRWLYGERSGYRRIRRTPSRREDPVPAGTRLAYEWEEQSGPAGIEARTRGSFELPPSGSRTEFLVERHRGYGRRRGAATVEYRLERPRWRTRPAEAAAFRGDASGLYGKTFARELTASPASAFVAEGSPVALHRPRVLPDRSGPVEARPRRDSH